MELTRALRASTLARKTPLLPGLTAGKTACHSPAAATAGFFLNLTQNSRVADCTGIDEWRCRNVSSLRSHISEPRTPAQAAAILVSSGWLFCWLLVLNSL